MRGFTGIGIVGPKTETNVGGLWRSSVAFEVDYLFTVGRRYRPQATDTTRSWKHVPLFNFLTIEDMFNSLPMGSVPVAVEVNGKYDLSMFTHPPQAVYLLGPEDGSLSEKVISRCPLSVRIPSTTCLNVATAGSIVLYDRIAKGVRNGQYLQSRLREEPRGPGEANQRSSTTGLLHPVGAYNPQR